MKKVALMLSLAIASLSVSQALFADEEAPRKVENPNPRPDEPATDPQIVTGRY